SVPSTNAQKSTHPLPSKRPRFPLKLPASGRQPSPKMHWKEGNGGVFSRTLFWTPFRSKPLKRTRISKPLQRASVKHDHWSVQQKPIACQTSMQVSVRTGSAHRLRLRACLTMHRQQRRHSGEPRWEPLTRSTFLGVSRLESTQPPQMLREVPPYMSL